MRAALKNESPTIHGFRLAAWQTGEQGNLLEILHKQVTLGRQGILGNQTAPASKSAWMTLLLALRVAR